MPKEEDDDEYGDDDSDGGESGEDDQEDSFDSDFDEKDAEDIAVNEGDLEGDDDFDIEAYLKWKKENEQEDGKTK